MPQGATDAAAGEALPSGHTVRQWGLITHQPNGQITSEPLPWPRLRGVVARFLCRQSVRNGDGYPTSSSCESTKFIWCSGAREGAPTCYDKLAVTVLGSVQLASTLTLPLKFDTT
jgi:hypothetical protein